MVELPTANSLLGDLTSKLLGKATKGIPDDTLKLAVNGKNYEGWHTVQVKRSLKAISGSFELSVVSKWDDQMVAWQILPGDSCILTIGKEALITGFVDEVSPKIDANSKSLTVSGRDGSADLVDCSIDQDLFKLNLVNFLTLAKRVAKPFGLSVVIDAGVKGLSAPFDGWHIQPGEAGFETLNRAAKIAGVILTNDGKGNVVITRASKDRASSDLVQGQNILSCDATFSMKERFSKIKVKGTKGDLSDGDVPVDFGISGTATDPNVKRYRPLTIIAETLADHTKCQMRANWEVSVRTGKGIQVAVEVASWRQANGSLWKPNQLVRLKAPAVGLNTDLLITDVTLKKSDSGTTTSLHLEPASAYDPDPTLKFKNTLAQLVQQESKRK